MRSPEQAVVYVLYFVTLGALPLAAVTAARFARANAPGAPKDARALAPFVCLLFAGGWAFVVVLVIPAGRPWVIEVPFHLTLGGLIYLDRVVKRMNPDPVAVASGLVCLVAVTGALHGFLRWTAAVAGRVWPAKYTVRAVALVAVLFVSGLAATGLIQQTGWLVRTAEPLTHDTRRLR